MARPVVSAPSAAAAAPPHPRLSLRVRLLLGLAFFALGFASLYLYGDTAERELVELRGAAMGTTWSVKIAAPGMGAEQQRTAADRVTAQLERINELMSTWTDTSELARFNAHASTESFPLSPETFAVFEIAQQVAELSGGAFDVTVGPLVDAWGFGRDRRPEPPSDDELRELRARTGWRKLALGPLQNTLRKSVPDLRADLSAVAKGYAVDLVTRQLEQLGHEDFLVEVGGELRARGARPDGGPWRVAIESPDALPGERRIHRVVELRDMAMATSGDYRNYYERDGRRFSHTIDPRTGRPVEHGLASVTVLHAEAAWADAWATALNVLGPDEGYSLAASQGLAAYFIARAPEAAGDAGEPGFTVSMTAPFRPFLDEVVPSDPATH